MTAFLERGDATFFYRPRLGADEVRGLDDVQRFFVILKPDGDRPYRQLIVGRKRLPDPGSHERVWAFVADVSSDATLLRADIGPESRARSAATAWYGLVGHEGHTHLTYVTVRREAPAALQEELNVKPQASYIVAVSNPDAPPPPGAGLPSHQRAQYPPALRERFGGRRFIPAEPELLDYPGAELVLIGAAEDASPMPELIPREAPAGARGE